MGKFSSVPSVLPLLRGWLGDLRKEKAESQSIKRLVADLLEGRIVPADKEFLGHELPKGQLSVIYVRDHGTVCRCCEARNTKDTSVVMILTNHKGPKIQTSLCFPCYERVYLTLKNETIPSSFELPRLNSLKMQDRYAEGAFFCDVEVSSQQAAIELKRAVELLKRPKSGLAGVENRSIIM